MTGEMGLNDLLHYVKKMKQKRGFDWTTMEQEFVLLSEEIGELAHEVWCIRKNDGMITEERKEALAFEVVDCLIFLISIAGMAGIEDIEEYLKKKEWLNKQRFEQVD